MNTNRCLIRVIRIATVTDAIIFIKIDIIDGTVICRHSCNHTVRLNFSLGIRHIHAYAQKAEPSRLINKLEFRSLKMTHGSIGICYVFRINKWFIHGKSLAVILHKIRRRFRSENLRISQTDSIFRTFQVRIIRKCLIACQINTIFRIF